MKFRKFVRTSFITGHFRWLLLELDKSYYVGIILMGLSKAYDYLPHGLLLSNLEAYLVNEKELSLTRNTFTNYRQRSGRNTSFGDCSD